MNELNIKFRDKYGEFERYIKEKYDVNYLSDDVFDNEALKDKKILWKQSRALRNILSHNGGMDFANITPEKLEEFCNAVDKIMHPKKAIEIAIKESNIYKVKSDESVLNVINTMINNNFTCTPIVNDDNKIIGVFSDHSLLLYTSKNPEIMEDFSQVSIKDIMEYCSLESSSEIEYKFVSKDTKEDELKLMFKNSYDERKRLEAIFITHSGKQTEKLLGMLTLWDMQN